MTALHCNIKWVMYFIEFPISMKILIFNVLKFGGKTTDSTPGPIRLCGYRGHLGLFFVDVFIN